MNSQLQQLIDKRKEVALADAGYIGGTIFTVTLVDVRAVEENSMHYALAQFLLSVPGQTADSTHLREIVQDQDLKTTAGAATTVRQWRMPLTGDYSTADGTGTTANQNAVYQVKNTDNNKVIVFYGYALTRVGNFRTSSVLRSLGILWKKRDTKTIDYHPYDSLDTSAIGVVLMRTPIMYKPTDELNIYAVGAVSTGLAAGAVYDGNIKLLAKVAEPLGNTAYG